MSSARKRSAVAKANHAAEHARQVAVLADYHRNVYRSFAEAAAFVLKQERERAAETVQLLLEAAAGKRPLPTREECRAWALKLEPPAPPVRDSAECADFNLFTSPPAAFGINSKEPQA